MTAPLAGEPLILVAAGGLGRETLEAVHAAGVLNPIGFVDENPDRHGVEVQAGLRVLGGLEALVDLETARIVLCAGSGLARQRLSAKLARLGVAEQRYVTVVHPAAVLPSAVELGTGSVLLAGAVLTAAVSVGRHVVVMPNAVITHDDLLSDYATICAAAALAGSVVIGERAYLGAGALVREGLRVGADAVLGMGAVALCDLPDGEIWVGNPATFLRHTKPIPSLRSSSEPHPTR
jgi:sugar O-acyltransferase (sialic acid O-acetyltransferase NeuD family)